MDNNNKHTFLNALEELAHEMGAQGKGLVAKLKEERDREEQEEREERKRKEDRKNLIKNADDAAEDGRNLLAQAIVTELLNRLEDPDTAEIVASFVHDVKQKIYHWS